MKGKQVSKVPYFLHKAICCSKTLKKVICIFNFHVAWNLTFLCRTQNEMFWRMFRLIKKELIQSLLDFHCMEKNSLDILL